MQPHGSSAAMLVIACVSITPSLLAQSNIPKRSDVEWSESAGAPGTITRAVTGEFIRTHANDRAPDVALLKGTSLMVLPSADTFGAHYNLINLSVNDVAVPPAPTSGSALSKLYVVNANGLQELSLSIQDAAPRSDRTVIEGGSFLGASRLVCGHLDNDASLDFVAADSAKDRVVVRLGGASPTTFTFDPSTTGTIVDVAIGRYQGVSGTRQIAVLLTNGLAFFTSNGTSIRFVPSYFGAGLIATEVNDRLAKDRLVWLVPVSGPNYALLVAGASAADDDAPMVLGAIGARALSTGDMDRDGDSEALFVCDAMPSVLVFDNLRSVANPSVTSYSLYSGFSMCDPEMGTSLSNNKAQPLVVDIDGDTDGDVFHTPQNGSTRRIQTYRYTSAAQLVVPSFQPNSSQQTDWVLNEDGLLVRLHGTFPTISGCDKIEVAMYTQADASTDAPLVPTEVFWVSAPSANVTINVLLDQQSNTFNELYTFVLRRVPTNEVVSDLTNRPQLAWSVVGSGPSASVFKADAYMSSWWAWVHPGDVGETGGSGSRPNIIPATGSGGSYPP